MNIRFVSVVMLAAILLASCSSDTSTFPDDSFLVVANSDVGLGKSVLQVAVVGPDGDRLGSPDANVRFEVAPTDTLTDSQELDAEWMWLVPDVVGLFRVDAEFDTTGTWAVRVLPEVEGGPRPAVFEVRDPTSAPNIGEVAPIAPHDTLASKPIEALTTDPDPDPDLYETTLEEAFKSGQKTVVVFATPAFCQSATCGPTLSVAKALKPDYPNANFIHIEVYTDLNSPDFSPTPEFLAPAVGPDYWNLPTEPWVFVVDEQGVVVARFEGSVTEEDLHIALG
jgi:hypothetical protein